MELNEKINKDIKNIYSDFARKFSGSDGIPTDLQEAVFDFIKEVYEQAYDTGYRFGSEDGINDIKAFIGNNSSFSNYPGFN